MTDNLLFIYILFFIASLIFSLIINRFLLKFSKTLGIRNSAETIIRWSSTSKPALGGISFYIIFLFSVITVSFVLQDKQSFFNLQTLGILAAVTVGFLLGLFDDAYNTHPWIKFFTQLSCGLILIITGSYIQIFDNQMLNYALTLFWVVGMMNSINMLDNMDGITTIVSLSVVTLIFTGMLLRADLQNPLLIIVLGAMASLTGFLFYNWHPSRMYMGDTGSQFLGVFLAALGINCLWNAGGISTDASAVMRFFAIATIFALPIIDTTTVSIKRILRGQSPFVGGKDHTTHHLSYLGLNDRHVAVIFAVISVLAVAFTLLITNYISVWKPLHTLLYASWFVALFLSLFIIANLNKDKN